MYNINILAQSANLPARTRYNLTSPTARCNKAAELVGKTVTPEHWVLYEKDGREGKKTVFAFTTPEGGMYATISSSFIDGIESMIDSLGVDFGAITVHSARSKAGREFIFPVLAD